MTQKIASAVDESLSKQQKEFFLRQQLAAIQRELARLDGAGLGGARGGGDFDDGSNEDDMAGIKRRIEAMVAGSEERNMAEREWKRLKRIPQQSAEHGVIQNYVCPSLFPLLTTYLICFPKLEWLTSLPWPKDIPEDNKSAQLIKDRSFLKRAREQLDADHYGLDKIKKRLIEYLAVLRLRQMALEAEQKKEQDAEKANAQSATEQAKVDSKALVPITAVNQQSSSTNSQPVPPAPKPRKKAKNATAKGPILLYVRYCLYLKHRLKMICRFVGPPGTGKTSLGQSIARALDRPFQRISLGGVRDEAEIRGHRKTYIASGPGLIAQALRKAGRLDPVLLLCVSYVSFAWPS